MSMFVDWITVRQQHGEDVPDFVGAVHMTLKSKDGRLVHGHDVEIFEGGSPVTFRGSFDTSIQIKSYRGLVVVSGNPSKFGRPDNLFGLDLDECMGVINRILGELGLPAFTVGKRLQLECATGVHSIGADGVIVDRSATGLGDALNARWTGARFSRLDLTANYRAGSELHAKLAIRSYQSRAAAYLKKGAFGDESVMWHNSVRSIKAYRKGCEMSIHAPLSPWVEWANENGIVRHEVALKSRYLSATGHAYWGNLSMCKLHRIFEHETAVLQRVDCSSDPASIDAVPARCRLAYAAWLRGEDVRSLVSRATLYRYRKPILEATGVDIAEPRSTAHVVSIVRQIVLTPAAPPLGYWDRVAA